MAANTKIEWAHHTFNPWIGCSKVSAGCANCYAEEMMDRRFGKATWGDNGTRVRTSEANWKKPLAWNKAAEAAGVRHRVFCASLADVFENRAELWSWRDDLFRLILKTPNLDWLLLTKRPENVRRMMPFHNCELPLSNVWIGTSVENQEQADKRIPELLRVPAKVRFLSMEPLLGPVELRLGQSEGLPTDAEPFRERADLLHWVIVGGESGHNARPMHPDWARSLRDQCQAAGVPFLFKQWGEWWPHDQGQWLTDAENHVHPDAPDRDCYRIGKHAAGRTLDGVEHDAFPESEADRD